MAKKTIDSFFKRRSPQSVKHSTTAEPSRNTIETSTIEPEARPLKSPRVQLNEFDPSSLIRDPGLRQSIGDYPTSQRDEVRRAYLNFGPYQPDFPKDQYPKDCDNRRFLPSWYKSYPDWLEYSPAKDRAFCLPCYLFAQASGCPGYNAFAVHGFSKWKKVKNGMRCPLVLHVGKDLNSYHRCAVSKCHDLLNQPQHIEKAVEKQTSEQVARNRLRLKTSIDAVKWLTLHSCALRGRDESITSSNRGNCIDLVELLASYNPDVEKVVLRNAPQNASYHSGQTQKEILSIFHDKIQRFICKEINGGKFCIIVDESQDESNREQMAIVLRFVDKDGLIQERFFDIVHVLNTASATLKEHICNVLARHSLSVQNIRGQGYDGDSNMRGRWKGLQALFLNDCSSAYYIHCFAHRLQLALVAASKEVISVKNFFSYLTLIVNIIRSSLKRHDQFRTVQATEIAERLAIDDDDGGDDDDDDDDGDGDGDGGGGGGGSGKLETGQGNKQIRTLKRAGDTRWGSHFGSISSLMSLFSATCSVLKVIINDEDSTSTQRAEADGAYDAITTFEFVFILHLMKETMEITDDLCQALQCQSQDILNAMNLVATTKVLIQNLRDDGRVPLLEKVTLFCGKHGITVPDMSAPYTAGRGRVRKDPITIGHHFQVDIFMGTIDSQLQELNTRFKEDTIELLILSTALDPRDRFKSFKIEDICKLAEKYYPSDFTEQEKLHLRFQLQNYELDVLKHREFQSLTTISESCQVLNKTRKSIIYPLVDRLIRLVLTLPVSTATTERAFSAMKLVKTRLRNRMEDDFLASFLITYIERDIARSFDADSIIDAFNDMKERRAQFKMPQFSR